ncbi:transposase-like protein [Streptomyces calvus]
MAEQALDAVDPVVLIDAVHVKIRDNAVASRPIHAALAVTTESRREIPGLWAGDGGEDAKHGLHILTETKNHGVDDVLMLARDGLQRPARGGGNLLAKDHRADLHRAPAARPHPAMPPRQNGDKPARLHKPVCTAPTEETARDRSTESAAADRDA